MFLTWSWATGASQLSIADWGAIPMKTGLPPCPVARMRTVPNRLEDTHAAVASSSRRSTPSIVIAAVGLDTERVVVLTKPAASRLDWSQRPPPPTAARPAPVSAISTPTTRATTDQVRPPERPDAAVGTPACAGRTPVPPPQDGGGPPGSVGSEPPWSSRKGGYASVIRAEYATTRRTHRSRPTTKS